MGVTSVSPQTRPGHEGVHARTAGIETAEVRWVSGEFPQWEQRAAQYHGERCDHAAQTNERPSDRDQALDGRTGEMTHWSQDRYNLGVVGIGRGAIVPELWSRYQTLFDLHCGGPTFWFATADGALDCLRARLVQEAVGRIESSVRSCSAGGEAITVVMDIVIRPDGRVFPLEASVAPRFVAMAQCVAERISNAAGPAHQGPQSARARLVFRWRGPCR